MKNKTYLLVLSILIWSTAIQSCKSTKITKTEKNTAVLPNVKIAKTEVYSTEKKTAPMKVKKESNAIEPSSEPVAIKNAAVATFPPQDLETIFKTNYPLATAVIWKKSNPFRKINSLDTNNHRVIFNLKGGKNMVIYSDKGQVMETRTEILVEQLPLIVYNAIKQKYVNSKIISAWTDKNTKSNASYEATIMEENQINETEVLIMENGTIIK